MLAVEWHHNAVDSRCRGLVLKAVNNGFNTYVKKHYGFVHHLRDCHEDISLLYVKYCPNNACAVFLFKLNSKFTGVSHFQWSNYGPSFYSLPHMHRHKTCFVVFLIKASWFHSSNGLWRFSTRKNKVIIAEIMRYNEVNLTSNSGD